jgi:N-formylglutamate deformylase
MNAFRFFPAETDEVPILISVPHCGTEFPPEVKDEYNPKLTGAPDDTDWFVDRLYNFSAGLGMSMIAARFSRWVIDLNRDPHNKPLYTDGRIITALCPTTTFLGEPLYLDRRKEISDAETERRLRAYFWEYHEKIDVELERLKKKFGVVLLWDCHSIRQVVKTVHPDKFPDLILGDADGKSAGKDLVDLALGGLASGGYSLAHNYPFKGGFITRHFGQPETGTHALQLEMTKVNYMDADETIFNPAAADPMRAVLKNTFALLIERLSKQKV